MKPSILSSIAFLLLLAGACGRNETSAGDAPSGKSAGVSHLAQYETRIADLLPLDRLRLAVDLGDITPQVQITDARSLKGVSWSWPSDRVRSIQVMGMSVDTPIDNQISVAHFRVLGKDEYQPNDGKTYVEQNYRSVSKEEMAQAQARMQEQLQARVQRGEITEEQARLAGGMSGSIMGEERIVETVEGVGDAARWTERDRTLAVGHRNVVFTVYADVSADSAANRDAAIAVAREILKN